MAVLREQPDAIAFALHDQPVAVVFDLMDPVRAGRNFGLAPAQLLAKIVFPAALPQIIIGLRISLGIAWLVVVAAEMVAVGSSGLNFPRSKTSKTGADLLASNSTVCESSASNRQAEIASPTLSRATALPVFAKGFAG